MSNRLQPESSDPLDKEIDRIRSQVLYELFKRDCIDIRLDSVGHIFGISKVTGLSLTGLIKQEVEKKIMRMRENPNSPDYELWHEQEIDYGSILPPEEENQ